MSAAAATDSLVIEKTLELAAPPQRVWAAITDPAEVAQWFPDRAEWQVKPGSSGALVWDEYGSFEVEIVEVRPITFFSWRWAGGSERPLQEYSTLVEWTLTERADGGTTLLVRESGFDSQKGYEENTNGWNEELGELVEYLKGEEARSRRQ